MVNGYVSNFTCKLCTMFGLHRTFVCLHGLVDSIAVVFVVCLQEYLVTSVIFFLLQACLGVSFNLDNKYLL